MRDETIPADLAEAASHFGRLIDRALAWQNRAERLSQRADRLSALPPEQRSHDHPRRRYRRDGAAQFAADRAKDISLEIGAMIERAERRFHRVCHRYGVSGVVLDGRVYVIESTSDCFENRLHEALDTTIRDVSRIAGLSPCVLG